VRNFPFADWKGFVGMLPHRPVTRRHSLMALLGLSGLCLVPLTRSTRHAFAQEASLDKSVNLRWRVGEKYSAQVTSALGSEVRAEDDPVRGWIVVVVGTAVIIRIARALIGIHRELLGGTVIDVSSDEWQIDRDPDLPGGAIAIIKDGDAAVYFKEEVQSAEELAEILGALKK